MDKHNTFHTAGTFKLIRFDYLAILIVCSVLGLMHLGDIHWGRFLLAFAYIDLIGYVPGAIAYKMRGAGDKRSIPAVYYILYNWVHSIAFNVGVLAIWFWARGGWEWAMLGIPIHLYGDRSVFGNIYKPLGVSFEPVPHPDYVAFLSAYKGKGNW